jgi:hypothetical protein
MLMNQCLVFKIRLALAKERNITPNIKPIQEDIMADLEPKKIRSFTARTLEDQQAFIENTWCDHCQKENLGLNSPVEYEQGGTVYIEGKCSVCAHLVITELTNDDF